MTKYFVAPYVVVIPDAGLHFTGMIGIQSLDKSVPPKEVIIGQVRKIHKTGNVEVIVVIQVSKREYNKYVEY